MTIVLKHLAQQFETDPYRIRQLLRSKFGNTPGMRWKWEDDDPQLTQVQTFLRSHFAGNHTKTSSTDKTDAPISTSTSIKRSPNPSRMSLPELDSFFNPSSSSKGTK